MYGVWLAIWDHTALPATRHKWTHPALTPAIQAGTRFTYPGGMEGWVDPVMCMLCAWCERCRGCELVTAGDFNCNLDSTDPISRYLNEFIARFLADRTATQYDWLLASSCCPSVCLWRCALWLSVSVHRTKSCTSVFLAGMFLFVVSDTFAVGCIV